MMSETLLMVGPRGFKRFKGRGIVGTKLRGGATSRGKRRSVE
jgi:hypothetical protein